MSEIIARMWWCGDEYCDCTQPIVERVTERKRDTPPYTVYDRERLWEGTFVTAYTEEAGEREAQWTELAAAAVRLRAGRLYLLGDIIIGPVTETVTKLIPRDPEAPTA